MRALVGMIVVILCVSCSTSDDPPPVGGDGSTVDAGDAAPRDSLVDTLAGPGKACADYLQCVAAVDPDGLTAEEAKYGAGTACWTGDGDASVDCNQECASGLSSLLEQHPLEEACGGCDPANDPSCSIVGEACANVEACETDRCLEELDNPQVLFDEGYCTKECVIGEATSCPDGSDCGIMANEEGIVPVGVTSPYCFRLCSGNGDCRSGYECKRIPTDDQGSLGEKVCQPQLK